ncbi:hypothetical protein MUO98_06315, partial [Candidatus Bathyarchaeota archaeon]|nr:hypothetical protein [Candidatus Bathyarchaeota archaeon]
FAQETSEDEPEYFMGILILESEQWAIIDSIKKVKDLQLGNMVILHPMDQAWNLTLIEDAIREANNLGLYTIFETYNFSDHHVRISPEQFSTWQTNYPRLLGILVQEVTGKQVDLNLWLDNSTVTINSRLEAEQAIIENITSSMQLEEFKSSGARILLQENVVSYASANTSYCDVLITKVFNAPNSELMIGLTRGMANSYDIPAWGLWVDTWREWIKPPADFTPNDVERALYEGWFYGAKYFFFEQGLFLGTFDRDWPNKYIIVRPDGKLTEYGQVIQRFYTFLQNQNSLEYDQPNYCSSIAVMIGQSGWSSRGSDWGLWFQSDRQGDFDYNLLNLIFPGIGDNWQIGHVLTGKEFTGLPFGMVDIISIYAPPSVMKQYKVIISLGWSQMSDAIAANIEEYVESGGIFFSLLSFTHNNETVDDLEDPYAWTEGFSSLFGVQVNSTVDSRLNIWADSMLHNVTFTEDTFWHPWNGKTYRYVDVNGTGSWFWKYKYSLYDENTRVIAWIDVVQGGTNAFIVENRKGSGYTYVVNTRNPYSLPDGVLTDVLTDFIYVLCAYHVRPMTYSSYPKSEYWLNQGQANKTVYLMHDNSTATQTFRYYVRALEADLAADKEYLVFDYLNNEFFGTSEGPTVQLNVTLQTNEAKLFFLLENDGEPQVLYSDAILSAAPLFADQQLTVALSAVEETANITKIYCAELESPTYILGTPFNIEQDYDQENKILTIISDSNIIIGWENPNDVSVATSTVTLTKASWNSSLGTLTVYASETAGQKASIQVQTGGTKPYYLKIDDEESSAWSYDTSTSLMSTSFSFTSDMVELVFGFKPIMIDQAVVSDQRADVSSVQSVGFHLAWMGNGSDISDAVIHINGTEYVTNQTGWASFDTSSDVVGKVVWNVTGVVYYGLTVYAKTVNDPFIIWDRINVTDSILLEGVVQAGSPQMVWLTVEYEYDSVIFDESKGTSYLNGEPMTWSSQNSRWEQTVTSNVLGPQVYDASAVDDELFGITAIRNQDMKINITWDRTEITKTEFEANVLGVTNVRVYVEYSYSKIPVVNATVSVNGKSCNETEQGTYICTIDGWSPVQGFFVEADYANFEQATRTVASIHVSNMILYSGVTVAIVLAVTFFVLRRKRNRQERES